MKSHLRLSFRHVLASFALTAVACGGGEDQLGGNQSAASGQVGAGGAASCGAGQVDVLGQVEAGGCLEDKPRHVGCVASGDAEPVFHSYCGRKEGRRWSLTARPELVGFEPCPEGDPLLPFACGFQGCSHGSIASTCSPADTCAKVAPTCGGTMSQTGSNGCFLEQCVDGGCPAGFHCAVAGQTGPARINCAYRSDGQCDCNWLTTSYPGMRYCIPN